MAPPVRFPPWAWLYLVVAALQVIPRWMSFLQEQSREIDASGVPGSWVFWLLLGALSLPPAFLALGIGFAVVPQARRWLVETAHHPIPAPPADLAAVVADLQRFVDRYAGGVEVRLSASSGDYARIYPVSWRRARLLVFRPFVGRWTSPDPDVRRAAEATLLHEIAHQRQGEHLVLGLGSPFSWLVRIWVAVFVVLTLAPVAILLAFGDFRGRAAGPELARDAALPALLLLLPVATTWLAELAADDWAAQLVGPLPVIRALTPDPGLPAARPAFPLLDHPPTAVRIRWLTATRRNGGMAILVVTLAAWAAVLVVRFVLAALSAVVQALSAGYDRSQLPSLVGHGAGVALDSAAWALVACVVLLAAWPQLSRFWPRLWTPPRLDRADPASAAVRSPAPGPYVAAVALPALMLLGILVPTPSMPLLGSPSVSAASAADTGADASSTGVLDPRRGTTRLRVRDIVAFTSSGDSAAQTRQRAQLASSVWTFRPDGSATYSATRSSGGTISLTSTWLASDSLYDSTFQALQGRDPTRLTSLVDPKADPPTIQLVWTSLSHDASGAPVVDVFQATVVVTAR